ncbi:NTE family protein [Desulfacinum hydrothermale DSM 13146]|uniref:NTE family protein n=1 Tax=Desulfacinum hydrothermale DSM 13146 TaxID=1121390 RepID=A0A1W1WZF0_9BACT|nr:patatin-like phospholipase family protein [Desulfacinum hydrothermale]SMC16910.1 NTE family protein [Desulfacinum hydrothermale DSM 13146]
MKTGLVLSGGAARALAHLGALQALDEMKLPVHVLVGTSMGAIIGALYAHYGSAEAVYQKIHTFVESERFHSTLSFAVDESKATSTHSLFERFGQQIRKGYFYTRLVTQPSLVPEDDYWRLLSDLVPDVRIEDLPVPFGAVALDILTGDEVVFTKGPLLRALGASASIPGMGPPVRYRGRLLVDGGWIDNVPCRPARHLGARFVVAVETSSDVSDIQPLPDSALEYALRSSEASRIALNKLRLSDADVVVRPAVAHIRWSDFHLFHDVVDEGRRAWREAAPKMARTRRLQAFNPLVRFNRRPYPDTAPSLVFL